MLQIENLILYFFLLMLGILFTLYSNAGHKQNRFSKALLEKNFEFILSKRGSTVIFYLGLVLLSTKIDYSIEK